MKKRDENSAITNSVTFSLNDVQNVTNMLHSFSTNNKRGTLLLIPSKESEGNVEIGSF